MPCNYKLYPDNWFTEIRPRILKRERNRCKFCKAKNYKPHPITGSKVVLTIAHLDQDINNNDDKNLAALCQKCHNGLDAPYRVRNRKINSDIKNKQLRIQL